MHPARLKAAFMLCKRAGLRQLLMSLPGGRRRVLFSRPAKDGLA
jgi:hypothetical protein